MQCPECDGHGSLMAQLARQRCLAAGGRRVDIDPNHEAYDPRPGAINFYYVTAASLVVAFPTVGGYCGNCGGTGRVQH